MLRIHSSNKLATVVLERLILRDDEQIAFDSLGYQHAVKWVAMMKG